MTRVPYMLLAVALVLTVLSAREYFNNNRKLTVRGKIWVRIALIFAAVSGYLYWGG